MSQLLDVQFENLRVRCYEAMKRDFREETLARAEIRPGDVVLSFEENDVSTHVGVRAEDRRALAAAIAPPGSLIGTPEEIAPLLEPGGGC